MKRGAIFIDNGYWVKTTLLSPTSPEWIVKAFVAWRPELKGVDCWMVYVYDATYDRMDAAHYEAQKVLRPGIAKFHRKELDALQTEGFCVRRGSYAPRVENGVTRLVQKGVDSLVVIDAMDELHHFGTETFCFFTADRDFVPVFARLLFEGEDGEEVVREVYVFHSSLTGSIKGIEGEVPRVKTFDVSLETWPQGGTMRSHLVEKAEAKERERLKERLRA